MGSFVRQRSWASWGVALVALAAIDAGITRTGLLWAPTRFETARESMTPEVLAGQIFVALRSLYRTPDDDVLDVVLVGNSRLYSAARGSTQQTLLQARNPGRPLRVHSVSVFGVGPLLQEPRL